VVVVAACLSALLLSFFLFSTPIFFFNLFPIFIWFIIHSEAA